MHLFLLQRVRRSLLRERSESGDRDDAEIDGQNGLLRCLQYNSIARVIEFPPRELSNFARASGRNCLICGSRLPSGNVKQAENPFRTSSRHQISIKFG
jgi:hypothetical protein